MITPISIATHVIYDKPAGKKQRAATPIPPQVSNVAEKQEAFARNAVQQLRVAENQRLRLQAVPTVGYDFEKLKSLLEPGDLILSYYPQNENLADVMIRTGQGISQAITSGNLPAGAHNFVHAALYTGEGNISEAVSDGVVMNRLDGERFVLKPSMTHSFLIVRPKDPKMAKEGCRICDAISARKGEIIPLAYSILKAVDANFSGGKLDDRGIRRYLQGAYYAQNGMMPTNKNGRRSFFCSYFVAWACQAAESEAVLKRVNDKLIKAGKHPIKFPELSHLPEAERGARLSLWAKRNTERHYDLLRNEIKLDFDPKRLTPQHLYNFIFSHPELFTQVMRIVAPD